MSIVDERIEWRCPACQKRYSIRADMPTPDACPRCLEQVETSAVAPAAPAVSSGFAPATIASSAADDSFPALSSATGFPVLAPEAPVASPLVSDLRPRYPALRLLAVAYRIMAGLVLAGAIGALVFAGYAAFGIEDAALRKVTVTFDLLLFGGLMIGGVLLLSAAEIIHLAMDIEFNTRRRTT